MTDREKQISEATHDFLTALPDKMKNGHLGAVICTIFEAFDLSHENRSDICKGVLHAMLEHDLRSDERAAQAAEDVIARASAKARK